MSGRIAPIPLSRAAEPLPIADLHIASGVVPFAHVVRMLIEEFGVAPLRDDWAGALDAGAAR